MTGKTTRWLITAVLLMIVGCILFVGVMFSMQWDFSKLSTVKYETNSYNIKDPVKNIHIITNTADVVLVPSEDGSVSVSCYEPVNQKHAISVDKGTLSVQWTDTREWYEHIGVNFATPKLIVYLPGGELGSLTIEGSTGDIEIPRGFSFADMHIAVSTGDVISHASTTGEMNIHASTGDVVISNVSAANLDLAVSTGQITVSDVTCAGDVSVRVSTGKSEFANVKCGNLISNGNTGGITLKEVLASDTMTIVRSTGDVRMQDCDAAEIFIKTDTGSVKGSLLTEKVFIVESDTGHVDVPKTVAGGRCVITTDTGDVILTIQ